MMKLLFAHQDPKLSGIYLRHLHNYFSVDSATDGLSALRKFRVSKPSIVISDYYLPVLSGLSLLRFIRNNVHTATTPFVFLTDHTDNSEALSFGANDWLDARESQPDLLLDRIFYHLKTNNHGVQIYRA